MTEKSTVRTELGEYIPLVERQPQFDEKFPMHEGWRIEIERLDPLSLRPALMKLYRDCIRNKRTVESLPSPDDPFWRAMVFIARLKKDDKVYREASCLKAIYDFSDYEVGETNARQRLVAACGFPGGVPDDESIVYLDSTPLPPPSSEGFTDVEAEEPEPDPIPDEEEVQTTVSLPTPTNKSDIPPHIQAQVDTIAASLKSQGQEVQLPANNGEALSFIRNSRNANGGSS